MHRAPGCVTGNIPAVPTFAERLDNGLSYETLDVEPNSIGDNTPVFEVPEGHYFVLGDNRDNSKDSRYWNFVPDENLIGRAFMIWFNWDWGHGRNWERIGQSIQ